MLTAIRFSLAGALLAPAAAAAHGPADVASRPALAAVDFDLAQLPAEADPDLELGSIPSLEPVVSATDDGRRVSFGNRVDSVKWELAGTVAVLTASNLPTVLRESQPFGFKAEGFFSRDTGQLGVDKLAHAWNAYVFSDVLYHRIARKHGGGRSTALTAAALGIGLQTYAEVYDAFHRGEGFSFEDMAFNALGAGFSVLRHTAPGVRDSIDYRLMLRPLDRSRLRPAANRFEQQWFLVAFKGAGVKPLARTPLRLVELHVGYHAQNFSDEDRAAGLRPERKPFVGVGLNVAEAFLRRPRGVAKVARQALEYLQPPYAAAHID